VAPHAEVVCSDLGAMISVNDFMHGSSFRGDGARALQDLDAAFRDVFGRERAKSSSATRGAAAKERSDGAIRQSRRLSIRQGFARGADSTPSLWDRDFVKPTPVSGRPQEPLTRVKLQVEHRRVGQPVLQRVPIQPAVW